ncbi:MAG: type II toxin-antitoxin system RelE/ParE family toxin [Pirellulaceae bacterium]|nr:type II toxin-antitoxin system RelE/ParE family toxin [Pirellulaceae bacterium]
MPSKVFWTHQAQDDLRAIRSHIARDAPVTAAAYVRRLRESVGRLREFPLSGQIVPEFGREEIREVLQGNYRLIYRVGNNRVDILTVFHSAQILDAAGL